MKSISILNQDGLIPYEIQKLENTEMTTTNSTNEYDINEDIPFMYTNEYLYHGIRFQKYLEKLEKYL